jgi:hypothetical protein
MEDLEKKELWAITAFYNPGRYKLRYKNYRVFRENLKRQGVPLISVELAFKSANFELQNDDAEKLIQIRGGEQNVLWQKEQLLNIAYQNLPEDCEKFAWLDCDVIFENDQWAKESAELLDSYMVIQPFETSFRLKKGMTELGEFVELDRFFEARPSLCSQYLNTRGSPFKKGHTGFAWAARKEVFKDIGFYNKMVVGGGDTVLTAGFLGIREHKLTPKLTQALADDEGQWRKQMFDRVAARVSFTSGDLLHLWHGLSRFRLLNRRFKILRDHSYDPQGDVFVNDQGILEWNTESNRVREIQKKVSLFFWSRNEDGSFLRGVWVERRRIFKRLLERDWLSPLRLRIKKSLSRIRFYRELAELTLNKKVLSDEKLSVVIMNWKKPDTVKEIIDKYIGYEFVDDVVIWNNNSEQAFSYEHPSVKVVNCARDCGLDSRFAAASLAQHENILFHDNDLVLPRSTLAVLFKRYLKASHLAHSCGFGRNIVSGYTMYMPNQYGRVDVVLTRALIMNRKYVPKYFEQVSRYDYVRKFTCGNGEDIIMNCIVRDITGERNLAHDLPFKDYDKCRSFIAVSIHSRPFHLEVRDEVYKLAINKDQSQNNELIEQIASIYPVQEWYSFLENPAEVRNEHYYRTTANVDKDALREAISRLSRAN